MQFLRSILSIKLYQNVRIMILIAYIMITILFSYRINCGVKMLSETQAKIIVITFEAWVQFVINKVATATSFVISPQFARTFAISAASRIPRMKVKLQAV